LIVSIVCVVAYKPWWQVGDNPFEGKDLYVNPAFQKEVDGSLVNATGKAKKVLTEMRSVSSAYWLDTKAKITGSSTDTAEGILKDAASKSPAPIVTLIVYDLPNRDCHAKASNGEICCKYNADKTCDYSVGGACADGLTEYKTTYVDPLVKVLAAYSKKVPIVLIIEPDSLPNIATNMADPHCANSVTAYKEGVSYAVSQIASKCPDIVMYLDAAHGGWIGWSDNMDKFVTLIKSLDILDKLRGMSTNVANYQPLGVQCPWDPQNPGSVRNDYCLPDRQHSGEPCCKDPCKLESQWNPANNELNYVAELVHAFGDKYHFVVDTGRNGVSDMRTDCANWCNIRGAGIGLQPTTNTGNKTTIDAYLWLKTPGETDGCTQMLPSGGACKRYDSFCGHDDCIGSKSGEPRVPEAGTWDDYVIKQLATNAIWA
jgi:cellulose 1,4-beta-cellobiosidase